MKNRIIALAIIVTGLLLWVSSCKTETSPGISIEDPDTLDAVLEHYVAESYYPFLYARLENADGEVIYQHAAVNRELLPDAIIDGQSWMRIWSMSKIVTISLVMDLVEEGILDLSDPVTQYIPEFKDLQVAVNSEGVPLSMVDSIELACPLHRVPMDSVMTIQHLIDHKAGFYYAVTGIPCLDSLLASNNLPKAENTNELINKLASLPLIHQPGTQYYYGTNTSVLGFVAERGTSQSLKELIEVRMTQPLDIEGLQYGLPPNTSLIPRITGIDGKLRKARPGELDIFGPDVPDYDPGHEVYLGGEGMLATADGYADFARMLLNRGELNGYRFLDESSIELMTTPHTLVDNPWGYNGFNLWVTSDSLRVHRIGDAGLWQGGGYEGTQFWIDPKREFVGVLMTQVYYLPEGGGSMYNDFRGALYQQLLRNEDNRPSH